MNIVNVEWRSVATDPPCEKGSYAYVLGCIAGCAAPVVYVADRTHSDEVKWFHWHSGLNQWEEWVADESEGLPAYWLPCPKPPKGRLD